MSSIIDICNMALSEIGQDTIVSLDESSVEARTCKRYYSQCRDFLLEDTPWSFAKRIQPLAIIDEPVKEWAFAYAHPSQALTIRYLIPDVSVNADRTSLYRNTGYPYQDSDFQGLQHLLRKVPYEIKQGVSSKIIASDQCNAYVCYTERIEDATKYSASFIEAFVYYLSSKISNPIVGGAEGRTLRGDNLQLYDLALSHARVNDFNQKENQNAPDSPIIRARK